MSGAFSGFSEEDIKRVQNGSSENVPSNDAKPVKLPKTKKVRPIVRFDESRNKTSTITEIIQIPEEAKLSKDKPNHDTVEIRTGQEENEGDVNDTAAVNLISSNESNIVQIERKPIDLDELQTRQKMMEEQNRRRKELLVRAIADKKKRTQQETQRLNEVQNEFKKLDALLSNDVKLLRRRIEAASIEYMEAQKKYLKVEKEFLDTKLAVQQKLEKKELLTEHLCKIIEQNEERKAEKLTELLNKLELGDVEEFEKPSNEATTE